MTRRGRAAAARLAAALVAMSGLGACGGGGGDGTGPTVPPSVVVSSGTGGTSLTSGRTLSLSVQVKDERGKVVSAPSVSWSSSNSAVASVSGSGVVTGALAGQATITASALGTSGAITLTVTPGTPTQLAVRTEPAGASAGAAFTTPAVVEVRDAAGNAVTGATATITASLASGGGTLRGTLTLTPVQGVATFTDLAVDGAAGSRTLAFAASGLTGATSAAFTVGAGAPSSLVLRTQPAGAAAGRPFTTPAVVEVQDAFGNVATQAATAITASVQGGGTLSGTTTVTAADGVATFTSLAVGGAVGARTLTFSAPGLSTVVSQNFVLQPGLPSQLVLARNPAGAGLNGPFTTQPLVEVRDAFGNVPDAAPVVTATLTSGTGSLTGASVTAVAGLAAYSALGINGTPGARTLAFTSPGLTPATFSLTPCDGTRGPAVSVSPTSRAFVVSRLGATLRDTLQVSDNAASCAGLGALTGTVSYTGGGGWLAVSTLTAPARAVLSASPGILAVGEYAAVLSLSAPGGTPALVPVTMSVRPPVTVAYGDANQKVQELAAGATRRVVATASDPLGADLSGTVSYRSRSPSVATVASDGTMTAVQPGQAWLVASEPTGSADSIVVNVVRATGPVVRLDVTTYRFAQSTSIVANVVLDTRGTVVGAGQIVVSWPTTSGTPALLSLTSATALAAANPTVASDVGSGTTRVSFASASGFTGVVPLARLQFFAVNNGVSQFVPRVVELLDPSGASLLAVLSTLQYPLVIP